MSNPTGTIHDLGYKRYVGSRRSTSTRWRVIMRNQIAIGWKKWWRYKAALFLAVVTMFISGAIMYFMSSDVMRIVRAQSGLPSTVIEVTVPMSLEWFCRFPAFILSLTLGAMIVAGDSQTGAFTFYYVRPVRARDYVIGKLAGYGVLVGGVVLVPMILLAGFRLGLSENVDQLLDNLIILPKVIAIGALATAAYTAIPLAISSLMSKRAYAIAMWAAYYVLGGWIAMGISQQTPYVGAFDLQTGLKAVTYELFDLQRMRGFGSHIDLSASLAAILLGAQVVAAIFLFWYQVSREEKTGVGASS